MASLEELARRWNCDPSHVLDRLVTHQVVKQARFDQVIDQYRERVRTNQAAVTFSQPPPGPPPTEWLLSQQPGVVQTSMPGFPGKVFLVQDPPRRPWRVRILEMLGWFSRT